MNLGENITLRDRAEMRQLRDHPARRARENSHRMISGRRSLVPSFVCRPRVEKNQGKWQEERSTFPGSTQFTGGYSVDYSASYCNAARVNCQ